jgi:hypothetical protein
MCAIECATTSVEYSYCVKQCAFLELLTSVSSRAAAQANGRIHQEALLHWHPPRNPPSVGSVTM